MLVVTPLFATLCGFAFWFYQVHRAEMLVYQKVREPVWATASFGCGDAGETGASMPGPAERASVSSGIPPIVPADAKDVPNIISTPTSTFRTDARVLCNEHVEDGRAKTMKRIASVAFRP